MLRLLFLLFICFTTIDLFAQEPPITTVKHFDLEDGLSHNQIYWVHKDSRGMMWIGTANGINRYDGKEFKFIAEVDFFYTDNKNICEDHEGDLWLKKNYWESELFFFNIYSEKIKSYEEKFGEGDLKSAPIPKKGSFKAIALQDSTIIIGTAAGKLISYDAQQKSEILCDFEKGSVWPLTIPGSSDFWVHSSGTHHLGKTKTGVSELYQQSPEGGFSKSLSLKDSIDNSVLGVTKKKELLLLSPGQKYSTINLQGEIASFDLPEALKNDSLPWMTYDPQQDRFLNTKDGCLVSYSRGDQSFYRSRKYKRLESKAYFYLYDDDVLWRGDIYGLSKIRIKSNPFQKLIYKDPDLFSPESFVSCRFVSDYIQNNELDESDLTDASKKKNQYWMHYKDKNGKEWYGSYYGLSFKNEDGQFVKYSKTNNAFSKELKNRVYQIFEDTDKDLWIVSANGLFLLDINKGPVSRYFERDPARFLPATKLRHMYQDKEGIYWIASNKGLIRWDKKQKTTRLFTTKDGLSNNHIMAVYEDDYGFIWMSSDNGIMQFEKSSERVKVYLPQDGISHREFNRSAHYRDSLGNIYFGSLNGITAFHPKDFTDLFHDIPNTPLLLTECKLIGGESGQTESRIHEFQQNQKIVLKPGDRHLQLKFALLDYVNNNPNLIQYVYSINEEEEWNIGSDNQLTLNALPYGDHTLKVKSRTGNGFFSNQILTIPITVLQPFYRQPWFIGCMFLAVISLFYFIQKMKTQLLLNRQNELENMVNERTKTIQEQAKELRQLDKAKSRFFANISHEFRTPLTLIINSLNGNTADQKSDTEVAGHENRFSNKEVEIMQRNAKRLQQLIDQLLDLSKLESGKMTLKAERGNFRFYLEQLIDSFKPLAARKGVSLNYDGHITKQLRFFDRDKIDKIVYNLLANAIKFTPEKGNIEVVLGEEEQGIKLEIKDTGIGMQQEEITQIFDRFYQVNKANDFTYEGTGLGLALVKELVEVHKGTITVESDLGVGSSFSIFLPLEIAKAGELEEEQVKEVEINLINSIAEIVVQEKRMEEEQPREELPILLIIEDNEDLLYHHQKTFSGQYDLRMAKDGISGLELAFQELPDAIICDVMMPGKNGYEVCTELKADERTNHIPIIMLTAKAAKQSKMEGLTVGANAYMTKPYDQRELVLRLENLLQQRILMQKELRSSALLKPSKKRIPTPEEAFVIKCQDVIESNLINRNFGVIELSEELLMSRTHLFRKLKSITGNTPTQFIRTYRLEKAKRLLSEYAGNATEVSYMVGFNNPNYFFKCFKSEYGMTVSQFLETTLV